MTLTVAGFCESGNEYLDSVKCGGMFLDRLRNSVFLKKDSAAWSWLFIYLFVCLFYRHLDSSNNRMSAVCVLCFRDWSCHCDNRP